MFTGIIEDLGRITQIESSNGNLNISVKCNFTDELKVDQSISHNGVCLTVVKVHESKYSVTAINETLKKTCLNNLSLNDLVNLERGMKLGERLDGHIVQGHVDQVGKCIKIVESKGSWIFTFTYNASLENVTIEKGSITINGVSLTVVDSKNNSFSVAIIPYTFSHTNFKNIIVGDCVNLEFDVIGKYVKKLITGTT